jgi:hypothetical protein
MFFMSQHLVSEAHLQFSRDPSKFECIDAMAARHEKVLAERAVTDEVNHHVLKLLMLKHPEKFAELDWIFPKLARWAMLLRQAKHNVAERHRLAAEAAKTAAASNSENDIQQYSTLHESASPLQSLSSPVLLSTRGVEPYSGSSSNANAAVRSNARKRSFDHIALSTDMQSCATSQSLDEMSPDRFSQNSKSSAAECDGFDACTDSFGHPLAASFEINSRAMSTSVSPRGLRSGKHKSTSGTLIEEDLTSTTRSLTNVLVRNPDAVFAKPAARPIKKARTSNQFEVTLSSSFSADLSVKPANDSFDESIAHNYNLLPSPSNLEVAADTMLRRDTDNAASVSFHSLSSSSASLSISANGAKNRIAITAVCDSIAFLWNALS